MANPTILPDTQKDDTSTFTNFQANDNIPSGFILKLYQMVNGAPDEVITWTSGGDAFVIGSDLNRLESETLPQYFRHNRFQSLVRQLNFYSFRKINRERNVWIYKHHLFHRDRPEDLHLVRRRTCPGLDGRKQRFSRFSTRKARRNENGNEKGPNSEDESSSVVESSGDEASTSSQSARKREVEEFEDNQDSSKKQRWSEEPQPTEFIDTSIIQSAEEEGLLSQGVNEDDEVRSLGAKSDDRVEMIEQSMIVSEVAMKLEEYARKAMKGRGNLRSRRGGPGVVTPPYGSSLHLHASSRGLLTYDDEYEDEDHCEKDHFGVPVVITDGDDSLNNEQEHLAYIPKELLVAPVVNLSTVKEITNFILRGEGGVSNGSTVSSAAVAGFCMSTAPVGDEALANKICQLISTCEKLALEFNRYRAALHPSHQSGVSPPYTPSTATSRIVWQREASRNDIVRDFKTFSVNHIQMVLGKNHVKGVHSILARSDRIALERTADVWLKSVVSTAA